MDVTVTIEISDEDTRRLEASLGARSDLDRIATAVVRAGAREFVSQATGRVVPSGIREERLYRVFLLLQEGVTLREAQALVAATFKETPGRARGLVEAALARYDVELRESVNTRMAEVLGDATWQGRRWEVELPVGFVRDHVLALAADTRLPDPERAGRGAVWEFPDETYQELRRQLGLPERPPDSA